MLEDDVTYFDPFVQIQARYAEASLLYRKELTKAILCLFFSLEVILKYMYIPFKNKAVHQNSIPRRISLLVHLKQITESTPRSISYFLQVNLD